MSTIRHTLTFSLLLLTLLLTACAEQDIIKTYGEGRYQSTLQFNLTQPRTRNIASENEINRMDILLFREGILEKAINNITSFEKDEQGHSYITLSLDSEGTRTAYVFANLDYTDWFDNIVTGITTAENIRAITRTAMLKDMAKSPLVMYGISDNLSFGQQVNETICELNHVAAKIEIHNKASNFELISARLLRSKLSSTLFPDGTFYDVPVKDFAPAESVNKTIELYSYENLFTEDKKATAVEISGMVNGKELTYTINLEKENMLIPLERNTLYTINVNNVRSHSLDLSVEVNPWIIGASIDETVSGNKPVVEVELDNLVGQYSAEDSTLAITSGGGQFRISAKANAECDIRTNTDWIIHVPDTRAASFIDNDFTLSVTPNVDATPRTGYVKVFNKINNLSQTLIIEQQAATIGGDKYMVVVVAGQSNAVGYDQSPIDAVDLQIPDRAWQLSYREGASPDKNLSIIPLSWCADDIDAYKRNRKNESGQYGLKGIHLPLAKELLKYIPSDYKIIVVPVAYTSTRFANNAGTNYGTYNSTAMRPDKIDAGLRWGAASAYRHTITDRVKYLLNLDAQNKFLGIVWCQGENDYVNSNYQYAEFTNMADGIFKDLSSYGDRSNYGVIDKRSWYNYSSCSYWVDWYSSEDASAIFGGYKAWNPDTFIHVSTNLRSNPDDGGPGMGKYHFGYNAYRTIAQMVAGRMNQNGLLFNNTRIVDGHFTDKTTPAQAANQGGSMKDGDIASSLIAMIPLDKSLDEKMGSSPVSYKGVLPLVAADGLKDINGNTIKRNALAISSKNGYAYFKISQIPELKSWSMSFMFKREGNLDADIQCIVYPDEKSKPFIGFRKYSSVMGVAGAAEFVVEPTYQNSKAKAIPGQFLAADKVRTLNEWVHYTVTYNGNTNETSVYMNGELVKKAAVTSMVASKFLNIYFGHLDEKLPSAEGLLMDFGLWGKVLEPSTIKKLFLMSYYGYSR